MIEPPFHDGVCSWNCGWGRKRRVLPPSIARSCQTQICVYDTVPSGVLTPNYCRMHKFGPTICACGPRIIAGMHISQICTNKATIWKQHGSIVTSRRVKKSVQTNDLNIGGPRGPCSYRSYLHRYRVFDHAIGRSVQLLAGNNWVSRSHAFAGVLAQSRCFNWCFTFIFLLL